MEIILVDDGSTDQETLITIKRIEEEHDNVKTYYFKMEAVEVLLDQEIKVPN